MALVSYNATISTANSDVTLFTVASGKELIVVGTRIYGGANGGTVTLTKYNGGSAVFEEKYTLGGGDVLALDSKIAFPAGYAWKVKSDTTGVKIDVNGSLATAS